MSSNHDDRQDDRQDDFRLGFRRRGHDIEIAVGGELDIATASRLEELIETVMALEAATERVSIDIAEVSFMDSTGFAPIAALASMMIDGGGRFHIVGPTPRVLRLIELHGFGALVSELSFPGRV